MAGGRFGCIPPELERQILEQCGITKPVSKHTKPEKPELLPASFSPPGTWVIPLYVANPMNAGKINKAAIGRSNYERWAVRKAIFNTGGMERILRAGERIRGTDTVVVRLTRLGGRKMDDDAIPPALKYVRDAIAYLAGVDDGYGGWVWQYGQEPGGACGVRAEIV